MVLESLLVVATFVCGLTITVGLVWGDLRERRIANRGVLQLVLVAMCGLGLAVIVGERDARSLASMGLGAVAFGGPWLAVRLLSRGGLGWGDIKLAGSLGLYLGWLGLTVAVGALVTSSLVLGFGLVVGALRSRSRHHDVSSPLGRSSLAMPFAPALAVGAVVAGLGAGLTGLGAGF